MISCIFYNCKIYELNIKNILFVVKSFKYIYICCFRKKNKLQKYSLCNLWDSCKCLKKIDKKILLVKVLPKMLGSNLKYNIASQSGIYVQHVTEIYRYATYSDTPTSVAQLLNDFTECRVSSKN